MMIAMKTLLHLLVGFGLYSSTRLAYREWTTGEACPAVGSVPACYVAFAGYAVMAIGLLLVSRGTQMRRLFNAGLFVAGGLALVGTVLELVNGNVCPRVGSIPMCYISLAMSALIGVLFWQSTPKLPSVQSSGSE